MSYWLRTWVEKGTSASQRAEAEKTFKQADTNVIPYLLGQLAASDAAPAREKETDPNKIEEGRQAVERSIAAEAALRYMGLCVTSAIPELKKLMASTNYGAVEAAAEILSDLGPQGAHLLVCGLTNANQEARDAIPRVLRDIASRDAGTNLLAELPALFDSLDSLPADRAFDCSEAAVQCVIAQFIRRLESTNATTRYVSAKKLGELGKPAQLAIPHLENLRNDPDKDVRSAAASALKRILDSDTWAPDYSKLKSLLDASPKGQTNR